MFCLNSPSIYCRKCFTTIQEFWSKATEQICVYLEAAESSAGSWGDVLVVRSTANAGELVLSNAAVTAVVLLDIRALDGWILSNVTAELLVTTTPSPELIKSGIEGSCEWIYVVGDDTSTVTSPVSTDSCKNIAQFHVQLWLIIRRAPEWQIINSELNTTCQLPIATTPHTKFCFQRIYSTTTVNSDLWPQNVKCSSMSHNASLLYIWWKSIRYFLRQLC